MPMLTLMILTEVYLYFAMPMLTLMMRRRYIGK
jgi:hypothetical protein